MKLPPECCTLSNMCAKHRAKMNPDLLKKVDAAKTEAEKQKIVNEYIARAFAAGEWKF